MQPVPRKPGPHNDFAERFLSLLKAKGFTQPAFALRVGADKATVWHWAQGHNLPSGDFIESVAKELGVSVGELFGENQTERTPPASSRKEHLASLLKGARLPDEQISIPILAKVAAGKPVFALTDGGEIQAGRREMERAVGSIPTDPAKRMEETVFAVHVRGDSMAPGLVKNDTVIARRYYPPPKGPLVEDGKLYILMPEEDGPAQVKRLLLTDDRRLVAVSDNNAFGEYPPRTIKLREDGLIQRTILGRVVKLIRNM